MKLPKLSGLAKLALIPFIGLGLGCSKKVIYDDYTSFGKTKIVKIDHLLVKDDIKQIITRNDSTYTFFDFDYSEKLGDTEEDYAKIKSKDSKVKYNINYTKINGKKYKLASKDSLDKDIAEQGANILKGKYNNWYQDINKEVEDSLRARKNREITKEKARLMEYLK